jgi:hypothetical protein
MDTAEPWCPRSSGAQCFREEAEMDLYFAPLERDRTWRIARSINISSLRDEEDCLEEPCLSVFICG